MGNKGDLTSDFTPAAEDGQWTIVLGGIPTDIHYDQKGLTGHKVVDTIIDRIMDFASRQFNHNYIEIRDPNGEVFRRVQAQEVNMQPEGTMLAGSYGSKYTSFADDEIYFYDPHEDKENMLRSGTDPDQTSKVFVGTKEQVMELYYHALSGVQHANEQPLDFSVHTSNGNTFVAEILQKMEEASMALGYGAFQNFDLDGIDVGRDDAVYDFPATDTRFETQDDLMRAIDSLERDVAERHNAIKLGADSAEKPALDTEEASPQSTQPHGGMDPTKTI